MPQLNPDPWLSIMCTSWLIYMIVQPKIKSHLTINSTTNKPKKTKKQTWTWPWT
uniref:ATP synthase complex subunit 8 n=2 Tax=Chelodina TaxID=44490 RepID=A0A343TE85_9SAUR|nr:ATP synthase F0 subunit 8 [Chelodina longicollis]YP_009473068.1 ATP synthase F0 subunit 8 [Chelodina expansa]AIH00090.1 ATP synthase F0 subunit 8 [Chelodina longicollis]AUW54979.1 ATP synthase F0 subunit 8 [Chelodina expansa]